MAVGVAAVRAVEAVAGVSPGLKWPNDLVADTEAGERKLAGILAEAELEGAGPAAVVVGLGLNVSWPDELPADLATIATSLHHLTDRPVDREDLLVRILLGLDDRYGRLDESGGRVGLREEYAELCRTLGRPVRVESRTDSLEGRAVDLTPEGHLVMETVDGRHEVTAGDVRHLRPA
jgi:BirA family biotin operon repressor/biotin-[acetyl-CoA-carboxylase] ligase